MILECISGVKSSNGSAVRPLNEKVFFPVFMAGGPWRKPDFETAELAWYNKGVEDIGTPEPYCPRCAEPEGTLWQGQCLSGGPSFGLQWGPGLLRSALKLVGTFFITRVR